MQPQKGGCKKLWFDVEKRYKTTHNTPEESAQGCGLMQKRDIRQPQRFKRIAVAGCGLMQKRDIRQHHFQKVKRLVVVV